MWQVSVGYDASERIFFNSLTLFWNDRLIFYLITIKAAVFLPKRSFKLEQIENVK